MTNAVNCSASDEPWGAIVCLAVVCRTVRIPIKPLGPPFVSHPKPDSGLLRPIVQPEVPDRPDRRPPEVDGRWPARRSSYGPAFRALGCPQIPTARTPEVPHSCRSVTPWGIPLSKVIEDAAARQA